MEFERKNKLTNQLKNYNKSINSNLDSLVASNVEENKFNPPNIAKKNVNDYISTKSEEDQLKEKLNNDIAVSKTLVTTQKQSEQQKIAEEAAKKKEKQDRNFIIKLLDDLNKPFNSIIGGLQGVVAYNDDNFDGNIFERIGEGIRYGWSSKEDKEGEQIISGSSLMHSIFTGNGDVSNWSGLSRLIIGSIPLITLGFLDPVAAGFDALAASNMTTKMIAKVGGTIGSMHYNLKNGRKAFSAIDSTELFKDIPLEKISDVLSEVGVVNEKVLKGRIFNTVNEISPKEFYIYKKGIKKYKQTVRKQARVLKDSFYENKTVFSTAKTKVNSVMNEVNKSIVSRIEKALSEDDAEFFRELPSTSETLSTLLPKESFDNDAILLHNVGNIWKNDQGKFEMISALNKDLFRASEVPQKISFLDVIKKLHGEELGNVGTTFYALSPEQMTEQVLLAMRSNAFVDQKELEKTIFKNVIDNPLYKTLTKELQASKQVGTINDLVKSKLGSLRKELLSLKEEKGKGIKSKQFKKLFKETTKYEKLWTDLEDLQAVKHWQNKDKEAMPNFLLSKDESILRQAHKLIKEQQEVLMRHFDYNMNQIYLNKAAFKKEINSLNKDFEDLSKLKVNSPLIDQKTAREINVELNKISEDLSVINNLKTQSQREKVFNNAIKDAKKEIKKLSKQENVDPEDIKFWNDSLNDFEKSKSEVTGDINSDYIKNNSTKNQRERIDKFFKSTNFGDSVDNLFDRLKDLEQDMKLAGIKSSDDLIKRTKELRTNVSYLKRRDNLYFKNADLTKTIDTIHDEINEVSKELENIGTTDERTIALKDSISNISDEFDGINDRVTKFFNSDASILRKQQIDFMELQTLLTKIGLSQLKVDKNEWNTILKKIETKLTKTQGFLKKSQLHHMDAIKLFDELGNVEKSFDHIASKYIEANSISDIGKGRSYSLDEHFTNLFNDETVNSVDDLNDKQIATLMESLTNNNPTKSDINDLKNVLKVYEKELKSETDSMKDDLSKIGDMYKEALKSTGNNTKFGQLVEKLNSSIDDLGFFENLKKTISEIRTGKNKTDGVFWNDLNNVYTKQPVSTKDIKSDWKNELSDIKEKTSEKELFKASKAKAITQDERELLIQKRILKRFINIDNATDNMKHFTNINYAKGINGELTPEAKILFDTVESIIGISPVDLVESGTIPVVNKGIIEGAKSLINLGGGTNLIYNKKLKELVSQLNAAKSLSSSIVYDSIIGNNISLDSRTIGEFVDSFGNGISDELKNEIKSVTPQQIIKLIKDKQNSYSDLVNKEMWGTKGNYQAKVINPNLLDKEKKIKITSSGKKKKRVGNDPFSKKLSEGNIVGSVSNINDLFTSGVSENRVEQFINNIIRYEGYEPYIRARNKNKWASKEEMIKAISNNTLKLSPSGIVQKLQKDGKQEFTKLLKHYKSVNITDLITKYLNELPSAQYEKTIKDLFNISESTKMSDVKTIRKDILSTLKTDDISKKIEQVGELDEELKTGILKIMDKPIEDLMFNPKIDNNRVYTKRDFSEGNLFLENNIVTNFRAIENAMGVVNEVTGIWDLFKNNAIKVAEDIFARDKDRFEKVSSSWLKSKLEEFISLGATGSTGNYHGEIKNFTKDEAVNKVMQQFNGELDKLKRKIDSSVDNKNFYIDKKLFEIMDKQKVKYEEPSKILREYDRATTWFKKFTLASPAFLFKNMVGNITEAYFNTGSMGKAITMKLNGTKLHNMVDEMSVTFDKFNKAYQLKHPNTVLEDVYTEFGKELKKNPDKYENLKLELKHHNGNRVPHPNNYKSGRAQQMTPYESYLFWKDSKKVGVGSNDFLDSMLSNKITQFAKTAGFEKDLARGTITFEELQQRYPEVSKQLTSLGLTKENFVSKYTNAIFNKATRSTDESKLGLLYDINLKRMKTTGKMLNKKIDSFTALEEELSKTDKKIVNEIKEKIAHDDYTEYGSSNTTRIIRQSHFDGTDLNKFERNFMARIFPFYNFMKINFIQNLRRMKNLDFRGLYKYQRIIKNMSINQGIDDKDKSEWATNNQMIPFKVGGDKVLYMKNPVPAMGVAHFILNDSNMINDIFNSSNPIIKYFISSAAGNVNLFFGNTYDSKLDQFYDIFAPRMYKAPIETVRKINKAMDDGDLTVPKELSILFSGILKEEDMSDERVKKLKQAIYFFERYMDGISTSKERRLAFEKALPILGYSPTKIDLIS